MISIQDHLLQATDTLRTALTRLQSTSKGIFLLRIPRVARTSYRPVRRLDDVCEISRVLALVVDLNGRPLNDRSRELN